MGKYDAAATTGRRATRRRLHLTHLGAAGWQITDGESVVLLDPFFSRLRFSGRPFGPEASAGPGDQRPVFGQDDVPVPETATIDAHVERVDYILVSHSHFNHCMDVPYIARKTGALVIGTESTTNLARAGGVPEGQLLPVFGGQDLEFGALSVKAIPSLHSALNGKRYFQSAVVPRDVTAPPRLRDYVEGGTLAYLLRLGGHRILAFGSMNYIEREIAGLRPTVVLVAAARPRLEIHDYTGRLLRALGRPRLIIATHWDVQSLPYGAPQDEALQEAARFVREVKAVAPRSRVMVPRHFETIVVGSETSKGARL
jgi:L-ascorbate metabolism protein UlaG (beta-lactamase superfamily)